MKEEMKVYQMTQKLLKLLKYCPTFPFFAPKRLILKPRGWIFIFGGVGYFIFGGVG